MISRASQDLMPRNPSNQEDGKPEPGGTMDAVHGKNIPIKRCETGRNRFGRKKAAPSANYFLKMVKVDFRRRKAGLFRANANAFRGKRFGVDFEDVLLLRFGTLCHRPHLGETMTAKRLREHADRQNREQNGTKFQHDTEFSVSGKRCQCYFSKLFH